MLPFLKDKQRKESGIAVQMRRPDEGKEEASPSDMSGVEVAMEDFCKAHERKDYSAMAKAFQAAFQILEAAPHDEIDHDLE